MPASWQFQNATIPSDHVTNVWSDPATPGPGLTVVLSACTGCLKHPLTATTATPALVAPAGATQEVAKGPWRMDYVAPSLAAGTIDDGRVLVTHDGRAITGYVRLDVVVPPGEQALADHVLGSFTLHSPTS